jgi:hypothetical protein
MKNWKNILSAIAVVAAMVATLYGTGALADTGTTAHNAQHAGTMPTPVKDVNVGGLPIFVSFAYTSFTPDAIGDVDTVAGFVPDYVYMIDDADTNGAYISCEWFRGMADGSALITADNGDRTYTASDGITVSSGHITISTACTVDEGSVKGWALRFSK